MRPSRTRPRTRRRFLAGFGAAAALSAAGCVGDSDDQGTATPTAADPIDSSYDLSVDHDIESWDRYDPDWAAPETAPGTEFETETVVENLEIPWDVEVAGNGEFFLTERVGRVSHYEAGDIEAVTEPGGVIDHARAIDHDEEGGWWAGGGEGGLLGVALHPNYPEVPVLYAFYTYSVGEDELRNRLVYFEMTEDNPEERVVIDDIPANNYHNGSRLAFGPRNYLWVTTGDGGEAELAAAPDSLAGKVLRLEPDGTAPADNPGVGDPRVYSYGHRNPQTLTFLPDGTPLAAEHGPNARDEVQALEAGGDYGWPAVRGGPDDGEHGSYTRYDDVVPPLVNTGAGATWAPSGGVFYTGDAVPALRNRLLMGGLISQRVNVVTIYEGEAPDVGGRRFDAGWLHPDYEAVAHPLFEDELGRIRHLEQGADGDLYAVTSNRDGRASDEFPREGDDRLVRILPG